MKPEDLILDLIDNAAEFDYRVLFGLLGFTVVLLWLLVILWVWQDSRARTTNVIFSLISVILVLPFNILGLIIYFVLRPKETIEEIYWGDLERRLLVHETSEIEDCTRCGFQLKPEFNSCPQCGTVSKFECGGCHEMVDKHWKYCPYCNTQLRTRRTNERDLSAKDMQEQINDTQLQAFELVGGSKNKYRKRRSFTGQIGNAFIKAIMRVGEGVDSIYRFFKSGIVSLFTGIKSGANSVVSGVKSKTKSVNSKSGSKNTRKTSKKKKNRRKKK